MAVVTFFVDVYYDCFHPSYPFMLPRDDFQRAVCLETDTPLVHAMLAIACRFVAADSQRSAASFLRTTVHPYMLDPMYWLGRAAKYDSHLVRPAGRLKLALLLAYSAAFDGHHARARDLLAGGRQAFRDAGFDHLDSADRALRARADELAGSRSLLPLPLERESVRRTYYMIWELGVLLAAVYSAPGDVVPFNAAVRMASCDAVYAGSLRDWNGYSFHWDDFHQLVFTYSPETPVHAYKLNSASFRTAAVNVLAQVVAAPDRLTDDDVDVLDWRVRCLLSKIFKYRTGPKRLHMTLFVTHQMLYTALVLLHRTRAAPALVFAVHAAGCDGLAAYAENAPATAAGPHPPPVARSYATLVDATAELVAMLHTLIACNDGREDAALFRVSPFLGVILAACVPVIASRLVLDAVRPDPPPPECAPLAPEDHIPTLRALLMRTRMPDAPTRADLDLCVRSLGRLSDVWGVLRPALADANAIVARIDTAGRS
ncbi:uncharacterized protein V1510DRAFT_424288 [Dipodascopsis tothii]|uniref:uncharacterized protein n=1 Tax=Dipodascopsis tothii TaxID=44089 RepID=UPI0034CD5FD9